MKSSLIITLISVLLLLPGCGENNSPAPVTDTPVATPAHTPLDEQIDNTQPQPALEESMQTNQGQESPEQRYQQFMAADEYGQQEIINNLENTGDDVALMAALITQNISSDAKQAILQTLMYGEYDEVAAVIRLALRDSDPDVVITAIDGLRTLDSPMEIPVLQTLAAETANEDVRDAANSAIDYLTP